MTKAIAFAACIVFFAASIALASLVSAQPQVNLVSPESGFTTSQPTQEFKFEVVEPAQEANQTNNASDTNLSVQCQLFLDGASANSTSVSLSSGGDSVQAGLQAGLALGAHEWLVKCGGVGGSAPAANESETRTVFVVQAVNVSEVTEERELEVPFSYAVTGFSIAKGAVATEGLYVDSWQANPREQIAFTANVSNTGAIAFKARLTTKVSDSEKQIVSIESNAVEVLPGETIGLKNEWTPVTEGEYFVEESVVEESGRILQRSFLKLFVGARQAGGASDVALSIAVICLIAIFFASIKVRGDVRSLKSGLE